MNTKPVNFAVIGCGALARSMHIPNIAASPRMRLHTCCDLSSEALAEYRERFGALRTTTDWREAVRDPDVEAICLATTEKLRLPVIALAAECGKPVYVEKPLAKDLPEVYDIQRVVKGSGIPFCVGHNRRCSPAMREAHRIFREHMEHPRPSAWRWDREGAGRPRLKEDGTASMVVRINDDWYSWKGWVYDKEQATHGPLIFEMTHFTDICNWFLAAEPVEVFAMESGLLNHAVTIRYAGGELATITMCANGTFGYPKELYEAMGQCGIVAVDHMVEVRTAGIEGAAAKVDFPMIHDRHPSIGLEGGISGWLAKKRAACEEAAAQGNPRLQFTAEPDKGHAQALERFVDQIRGIGPEVCGVDDAVLATRVAFAALRAAAERRVIRMEEI
jgi:predicted dehydrogenase